MEISISQLTKRLITIYLFKISEIFCHALKIKFHHTFSRFNNFEKLYNRETLINVDKRAFDANYFRPCLYSVP